MLRYAKVGVTARETHGFRVWVRIQRGGPGDSEGRGRGRGAQEKEGEGMERIRRGWDGMGWDSDLGRPRCVGLAGMDARRNDNPCE
jgi:hypothetical protein